LVFAGVVVDEGVLSVTCHDARSRNGIQSQLTSDVTSKRAV